MHKYKTLLACFLVPFFILISYIFLKIRHQVEFHQKVILVQEMHQALDFLMVDLAQARENAIQDVPADGQWYDRIDFKNTSHVLLGYFVKDNHLWRVKDGQDMLIADNVDTLRIRRQRDLPDILEMQIQIQKNVSMVQNFKIRIQK